MAARLLDFLFFISLLFLFSQALVTDTLDADATSADTIAAGGPDASALTRVVLQARVGVLLDEIPNSERAALVVDLTAKGNPWWRKRAEQQIDLTSYRLTYRAYYHGGNRFQLVLPDHDQWTFVWDNEAPALETRQGHRLFSRKYTMSTYILSTHSSIKKSEKILKDIGGEWREDFTLPIDPTLLFQRTGFACIDEGQYPPNVADPEKMEFLYDDTCEVERTVQLGPLGCKGCHCTLPLPTNSCVDALKNNVGSIDVEMVFTRIAYDANLATQYRTPVPTVNGADLTPSQTDLAGTRIIYRYFPPGGCERAADEMCIGAYGWRRLLLFDAVDKNAGPVDLDMDTTDFVTAGIKNNPPTQEIAHGLYEYSSCHQHYHFRHFGQFTFETSQASNTSKRGFCVASVNRWANAEWAPTWSDFSTCETQGITSGWSDVYQAGISCQWLDITDLPRVNPGTLSAKTNYDGLLCEGILQTDSNGNQIWQPTPFTTLAGNPVEKQKCNRIPNYDGNNLVSASVTVPPTGESYVTQACLQTNQHFGPLRNCEFAKVNNYLRTCTPGQTKTVTCTWGNGNVNLQVLRVCEASTALNVGTACRHQDAIKNVIIQSGDTVSFTCPSAKPGFSSESGGSFSLYNTDLWGGNPRNMNCV